MTTTAKMTPWRLVYETWDPDAQPVREALTTLANGHLSTRGAAEESQAGGPHYPGTYLADGYNRLESQVAGRVVANECLVNWPNWLALTFRAEDGDWFTLESAQVLDYRQELDIKRGLLSRRVHFRDQADREFRLESRRLVHMDRPGVAALEWRLTSLNWSGTIEIRTAIDGRVANTGVERYRELASQHLEILEGGVAGEDAIYLTAITNQSHLRVTEAARTRVFRDGVPAPVERRTTDEDRVAAQHITLDCEAKKPVRVEKVLAVATARDHAISEPQEQACKEALRLPGFADLLASHERAWRHIWNRADLEFVDGDTRPQLILRLHIFHILQTASAHVIDADVGIPARGLHGEAYRGHIFWDELFVFPYLNLRIPELTRSLLMYRFRRLDEARHLARAEGLRGAMFPWQSGREGREESQVVHLNPETGKWNPDNTHRQRHVNAAIAYNVWQYYQATGDLEFMSFYGAELLVEIARFWASLAVYNAERERYEIHGVVGPDEFHTCYPDSDELGLRNNAYTNVMASWCIQTALDALDLLSIERRDELMETVDLSMEDFVYWHEVGHHLYVPFQDDGIISQFEGWEDLEALDWQGLREKYGDIQRLDRILGAEGDDPNRYQATKQADVLMLFYLFTADELHRIFARLGYIWDAELIPRNVRYYLDRTSHGSTLSRVVHAWVLARSDRRASWHLFLDALASDVEDIQGGTTSEGIHMGAMAGTVDLVQRCYAGLTLREDAIWLDPQLPDELTRLAFRVRYLGQWLSVDIKHDGLTVTLEESEPAPLQVGFGGELHTLEPGDMLGFPLQNDRTPPARNERGHAS